MYDLADHELTNFCIDAEGKEAKFRIATFSPDEKYVVGGTEDGKVMVMDSCGIRKKVGTVRQGERWAIVISSNICFILSVFSLQSNHDNMSLDQQVTGLVWSPSKHLLAVSYSSNYAVVIYSNQLDNENDASTIT